VRTLWCVEYFKSGQDVHLHGLIAVGTSVREQDVIAFWHDWFTKYGICRISKLKPGSTSAYKSALYVAKYCTLGVDSFEYLLLGARSQWKNLLRVLPSQERFIENPKIQLAKCENRGILHTKEGLFDAGTDSKLVPKADWGGTGEVLTGDGGSNPKPSSGD
jgi:hypothetical protein